MDRPKKAPKLLANTTNSASPFCHGHKHGPSSQTGFSSPMLHIPAASGLPRCSPIWLRLKKTGIPKWLALVSGNMDFKTCGLPLLLNFEPYPFLTQWHPSLSVPNPSKQKSSPPASAPLRFGQLRRIDRRDRSDSDRLPATSPPVPGGAFRATPQARPMAPGTGSTASPPVPEASPRGPKRPAPCESSGARLLRVPPFKNNRRENESTILEVRGPLHKSLLTVISLECCTCALDSTCICSLKSPCIRTRRSLPGPSNELSRNMRYSPRNNGMSLLGWYLRQASLVHHALPFGDNSLRGLILAIDHPCHPPHTLLILVVLAFGPQSREGRRNKRGLLATAHGRFGRPLASPTHERNLKYHLDITYMGICGGDEATRANITCYAPLVNFPALP